MSMSWTIDAHEYAEQYQEGEEASSKAVERE